MSTSLLELSARALIVYFFLLVAFRLTGRKQTGDLAPFDLIFLLVISNAVQNSLNAGDTSILGGLVSAATLIIANYLVGWLTYRSRAAALLIEGMPEVVIHDGRVNAQMLKKEHISHDELMEALRTQGCNSISKVQLAILETNGKISVITKDAS